MGLEGVGSSPSSPQVATEMQVKLQKGALQQEGKIVMQLIESAVAAPAAAPSGGRGHLLNVVA